MIYFIQEGVSGNVKVGFTDSDGKGRLSSMQIGNSSTLNLIGVHHGSTQDEKELHRKLTKHHVRGEWFRPHEDVLDAALGLGWCGTAATATKAAKRDTTWADPCNYRISSGSVYQRGRLWWLRYQRRGQQVIEPGGFNGRGAQTEKEATDKLRLRHDFEWDGPSYKKPATRSPYDRP